MCVFIFEGLIAAVRVQPWATESGHLPRWVWPGDRTGVPTAPNVRNRAPHNTTTSANQHNLSSGSQHPYTFYYNQNSMLCLYPKFLVDDPFFMVVSNYERIRGDQMVPPDLNPCHAGDPCGENGKCIPDSSADYGGPLGGGGYTCKCFKGM